MLSIHDIADEIIVVDTGSEDATVDIAESFGARVFFHDWKDDFSLARNIALEKSRGKWIFVIDADERLDESSKAEIEYLIKKENPAIPQVFNGRVVGPEHAFYKRVLFPRLPELLFQGMVHESLIYKGEVPQQWHNFKIILHHIKKPFDLKKQKYYLGLIKKELDKSLSNEQYAVYYKHLGDHYLALKKRTLALEAYLCAKNYFERSVFKPEDLFFAHLLKPLIQLHLSVQKSPTKAYQYAELCVRYHPDLAEVWCYLAYLSFLLREFERAKLLIEEILEYKRGEVSIRWLIDLQFIEARCLFAESDYVGASSILKSLYQVHPQHHILACLCLSLISEHKFSQAIQTWGRSGVTSICQLLKELALLNFWTSVEDYYLEDLMLSHSC